MYKLLKQKAMPMLSVLCIFKWNFYSLKFYLLYMTIVKPVLCQYAFVCVCVHLPGYEKLFTWNESWITNQTSQQNKSMIQQSQPQWYNNHNLK